MYYVYVHTRNDLRTPFYVGKGTGGRLNETYRRNTYWKRIASKTSYTSKILKEFEDEEEALRFERRMQLQYQSIGIRLSNIAECGGRGSKGIKHTHKALNKIGEASKNLWATNPEYAAKMRDNAKGLNNGFSDPNLYTLFHKDHGYVTLTQFEFRTKFNLCSSRVSSIISRKRITHKGWSLPENKDVIKGDNTVFTFIHETHGKRTCKKADLLREFKELNQPSLCRLIHGEYKSTKGWSML